jgi:HD-GYP domain-containing protein (c-di-GMP phosphodiesterase class II)
MEEKTLLDEQVDKEFEIQQMLSNNPRINRLLKNVVGELRTFTEEQAQQITALADIGKAMSAERNPAKVLEMILSQARKFTKADAGTLYLLTKDGKELSFNVLHNDTLNSYMGGTSGNKVTLPNVPLYDKDGNPNHSNVSAYVALTNKKVNIPDVYKAGGFNFEGTKKFDAMTKYRSMSMLVLPMRNHEDELIGVLQLINAKDVHTKESIPFSPEVVDLADALASQAAVLLTQQQLISNLKELFEAFIRAIATAIEEKSKYTGGHIERVAELTMMIAKKINEVNYGPFTDMRFTDDEMEELKIAAWMHDTGKVTTPEYVVDKANKLETIFDRIELIKTRWQVIRLTRLLEAERAKLNLVKDNLDSEQTKKIDEDCQADINKLNDDLTFIEISNKGGEFMSDDKIERLKSIQQRKYIENNKEYKYLDDNETYNLSIRKGTLTDEERDIMNGHVSMTKKILERLPWPNKMSKVTDIASAHHEKLDGTGYPLGLKGEQINLQARIMAVADIFEALSAKDRPYKKPMSLSQAIKILGFMVKDNHIDKDIVDLFINSGLVYEYAQKYLNKEQIDIELKSSEKKESL